MFDILLQRCFHRSDVTFSRIWASLIKRVKYLPDVLSFRYFGGFAAYNRKRLKKLNNSHKGERCFILANGPSLNLINFELLRDEFTFGMNRIYLMKEKNGFLPSCIACTDEKTLLIPFKEEFENLTIPCFFPYRDRKFFSKKDNQYFIGGGRFSPKFQKDASKAIGNGKTVAYVTIQLAFAMGFDEVYIVGKDHTYNAPVKAGAEMNAEDDNNHFIKGYYKNGTKWDAPDHYVEEYAYKLAKKEFENAGRKIMNATEGGKLEIFERVDFKTLFPKE